MKYFKYLPLLPLVIIFNLVTTSPLALIEDGHTFKHNAQTLSNLPVSNNPSQHLHTTRARKGPPKDPPASDFKYGELQKTGRKFLGWLENSNSRGCRVQRSQITYQTLEDEGWEMETSTKSAPGHIYPFSSELGLPDGDVYTEVEVHQVAPGTGGNTNDYIARVGPGVIVAMSNQRFNGYPWSDIAMAVYERFHPNEELKYIFRYDVKNDITRDLIRDQIYPENGLRWPDWNRRTWKKGTDEYEAILGTPNGKGVLALLLSHYERGTKEIPEVITFAGRSSEKLQIFLPIQDV